MKYQQIVSEMYKQFGLINLFVVQVALRSLRGKLPDSISIQFILFQVANLVTLYFQSKKQKVELYGHFGSLFDF